MSITFNLDGSVTRTADEEKSQQEVLQERIDSFNQHIFGGLEELRTYRDDELIKSDWTQNPDSPLNSTTKTAWATYRTKLRDLPNDAKAPFGFEDSDWPIAPGQSSINPDALGFISRNNDPLGIATTSWVGLTTDMVDKGTVNVTSVGVGTDIIGVGSTLGLQIGDHLKKGESLAGIVAGITTVSVSLASTTPIELSGLLNYYRSDNVYYAQQKPQLTYALSASAASVSAGANIGFTITLTNQIVEQNVDWNSTGPGDASGTIAIVPTGTTGVGTVTYAIPSGVGISTLTFTLLQSGISTSVGVTTT
jgi:hypothetical protein